MNFKSNLSIDPIGKLLGLRYKSHPWHGIDIGEKAPTTITAYIEMVPSDTVKYELDKKTGYLRIDRPQKYSSILPALYGFLPQTFCGNNVAEMSRKSLNRDEIVGDSDPLDICVLTEKEIFHGDIIVHARPIGGFRMIDGSEADDKIIAVLENDAVYGKYKDISDCPEAVIDRLKHYFLTYKDMPGAGEARRCEIPNIYGETEAMDVISRSMDDYKRYVKELLFKEG
ncbi:MAG: inorganic pyrophosphatase [Leptospiraceae bacterium]|nr:inorganic pyrophosphatase [Leptospiraceae bacterium]MCP5495131.1 inorganic pyrophosphatase [Leptospiraceae bacterium]